MRTVPESDRGPGSCHLAGTCTDGGVCILCPSFSPSSDLLTSYGPPLLPPYPAIQELRHLHLLTTHFSGSLSFTRTHLIDLFLVHVLSSWLSEQKDSTHSVIHSPKTPPLSSHCAGHCSEQGRGALHSWSMHSSGGERQEWHG